MANQDQRATGNNQQGGNFGTMDSQNPQQNISGNKGGVSTDLGNQQNQNQAGGSQPSTGKMDNQ